MGGQKGSRGSPDARGGAHSASRGSGGQKRSQPGSEAASHASPPATPSGRPSLSSSSSKAQSGPLGAVTGNSPSTRARAPMMIRLRARAPPRAGPRRPQARASSADAGALAPTPQPPWRGAPPCTGGALKAWLASERTLLTKKKSAMMANATRIMRRRVSFAIAISPRT